MTEKNCNQRCRECYIKFPISKDIKDFISPDKIKEALIDTKKENLECIYLTGAEPMTHPDFNYILRMCLKRTNVCICTNGSFINEKKARFLKKVEDESDNEIIFKLSINHYDEIKNDEVRSRGAFRTTLSAFKNLIKYGFNPILCVTNFYNENPEVLKNEFKKLLNSFGFNAQDNNIVINSYFDKNKSFEYTNNIPDKSDCQTGRVLTSKGVWACPFLTNDYRGRCGTDFTGFARHNYLETDYCAYCKSNNKEIFSIDYSLFTT